MRFRSPLLVYALWCVVTVLAFALPDEIQEQEGSGLKLVTDPSDADVFVDGIRKGKTPIVISDLRPGAHRLEVLKDGYRNREEMILVRETGQLSIFLELRTTTGRAAIKVRPAPGSLENVVVPFEPVVIIDGVRNELGTVVLSVGLHSVRARAFGWEDRVKSIRVETDGLVDLDMELVPAESRVSDLRANRKRFNPLDGGRLGATDVTFEVSAPGSARVSIVAKDDAEVFSRELSSFTTWDQEFEWDGRTADGTPLPDGEYTVVVRAVSTPPAGRQPSIEVERLSISLDSSVGVRPASLSSGVAGALYAPQARFLPSRSFQIEGSVLFGSSYEGATEEAPPFAFGARFAPADGWEAGAAANIIGASSDEPLSSFSFSVRRALVAAKDFMPFSAALSLRYVWASDEGPAPFAASSGVEIDVPLELGAAGDRGYFFGFSPGLRWAGNVPGEAVPFAILAAAAGRRSGNYVTALSARTERDLGGGDATWPILVGAEYRFFPPPSTIVYGLIAGARIAGDERGIFGGISFGFLY